MTVQTVGHHRPGSDGVNNVLTVAVMTGGAGSGSIGGNIVGHPLNLTPGENSMTASTGDTAGEVTCPQLDAMGVIWMPGCLIGVAVCAADLCAVQAFLDGLADTGGINPGSIVVVAGSAVRPVQGIDIRRADKTATPRVAEGGRVTGVTAAAKTVDHPVVVRGIGSVGHRTVAMASIACLTAKDRNNLTPDNI